MADGLESEVRGGSSGTTSEEDLSEVLDDDKLPTDFPPERPTGSLDYGVTPQEQRVPEPITERVGREQPEGLRAGDVGTGDTATYDIAPERADDLSAEEAAVHVREVP